MVTPKRATEHSVKYVVNAKRLDGGGYYNLGFTSMTDARAWARQTVDIYAYAMFRKLAKNEPLVEAKLRHQHRGRVWFTTDTAMVKALGY